MRLNFQRIKCFFIGHWPDYPLCLDASGDIFWTCRRCGRPCLRAGIDSHHKHTTNVP